MKNAICRHSELATHVLTKPNSCSKSLFTGGSDTYQKCHKALDLKTLNLEFIRALKWGSMRTWISAGTGILRGQS